MPDLDLAAIGQYVMDLAIVLSVLAGCLMGGGVIGDALGRRLRPGDSYFPRILGLLVGFGFYAAFAVGVWLWPN